MLDMDKIFFRNIIIILIFYLIYNIFNITFSKNHFYKNNYVNKFLNFLVFMLIK